MTKSIACPRCGRLLEYSGDLPNFCSACGRRLAADTPTPPVHSSTTEHRPEHSGLLPFGDSGEGEAVPAAVGEYKLFRMLGSGGMGRVFEAEPAGGGPRVAVKVLSSQGRASPTSVERFRQEGRLASQISHPRCVFVLGADTDSSSGRPYIVMELMPGDTLRDLVERRGPLPPQEAIGLILDVIEGLQEAHRLGVVHRDVKPSNCFLMPDGRVKVGDFGLSKSLTSTRDLTQTGSFLGTILYASPEQIRGQDVDFASDVYSVCATLFYLVTGRAPFDGDNPTAALARVISEDAPKLREARPDAPRALERVVARGLERERAWRYGTLAELRAALIELVPSQLSFGGLWVRLGAYLIDMAVVHAALVLPITLLLEYLPGVTLDAVGVVSPAVLVAYFVLLEGVFGASLGKRLTRLRVCRAGTTDPPGVLRTLARTIVFGSLVILTFARPAVLLGDLDSRGLTADLGRDLLISLGGLILLLVPMRRSNDYRGLHELFSGTCVMELPRDRRAAPLKSRMPGRLEALLPPALALPKSIGPYTLRAASGPGPAGERVLLGEDALLGRRVVIRLTPGATAAGAAGRAGVSRPTRLRALGSGLVNVERVSCRWEAFVAPVGAPLQDVVSAARPLQWPDARPLLEQLTDELVSAGADGTLPVPLTAAQVWVTPEGQVQLLDFPVPPSLGEGEGTRPGPAGVLAEAACLALEGQPRPPGDRGPVRAPVPVHADRLLGDLLAGRAGPDGVGAFAEGLAKTRPLPAAVDVWGRLAQLGVQALVLSPGLLLMFLVAGLCGLTRLASDTVSLPLSAAVLLARDGVAPPPGQSPVELSDAEADRLRALVQRGREVLDAVAARLNFVERVIAVELRKQLDEPSAELIGSARSVPALEPGAAGRVRENEFPLNRLLVSVLGVPLAWAVGAWLLPPGLSFRLFGYRLVTADGRPASRRRSAARALLTWLPVALPLAAAVVLAGVRPEATLARSVLWLAGAAAVPLLALGVAVSPTRTPADRILGLRLVAA